MDMTLEKERNQANKEKAKMYIQYLSNIFSQPLQEKPKPDYLRAKEEFERLIKPDAGNDSQSQSNKKYEWDFDPNEYTEQNKQIETVNE